MIRGLYIAATNMETATKKMNVVGNNIANVNSFGYKKDNVTVESFNDVLISKQNGSNINMEKPHKKIDVKKEGTDYEIQTEDGFFRVKNEEGISNNKYARFSVDKEGYLSTYYLNTDKTKNYNLGNRLIDNNGKEIQVGENFEISENGEVIVNGEIQAQLVKNVDQDVLGTINSGVRNQRVYTNFSQGELKRTDRTLDVGLKGEGFIEVSDGENTYYTRNGSLALNEENTLVTSDGEFIQGRNGKIQLEDRNIKINGFGEIIKDDELIDRIEIKDFSNIGDLRKVGGSLFSLNEEMSGEVIDFEGEVQQGYIESSNVSSIEEMIKMTKISKNYESNQKVIKTLESTLDKVINQVGTVR